MLWAQTKRGSSTDALRLAPTWSVSINNQDRVNFGFTSARPSYFDGASMKDGEARSAEEKLQRRTSE